MVYNANCYFSPVSEEKLIADDLIVQAREATDEDLLVVHTRRYLNKLKVLYLLMCFSSKLYRTSVKSNISTKFVIESTSTDYRMVYFDNVDNIIERKT